MFEVSGPTVPTITGQSTTEFSVTFTAKIAGVHTATIEIVSTDPSIPVYQLSVRGTGLGPGIEVVAGLKELMKKQVNWLKSVLSKSSIPIEAHSTKSMNHQPVITLTLACSQLVIQLRRRFRIRNTGNAPLDIENDDVIQVVSNDGRPNYDEFRVVFSPADNFRARRRV